MINQTVKVRAISESTARAFEDTINKELETLKGRVIDVCPITTLTGGFGAYITYFDKKEKKESFTEDLSIGKR